ncbi:hypothetical protein N7448_001812 [Penicillium atrosanguineum]|nr:hypothetical protein N7448_001812 [Penicillium atrosanguineum]
MRLTVSLFAGLAVSAIASPISSIVEISSGRVQGNPPDQTGVRSFKGIPFAASPVGENRWKSPQPELAFEGTYNATVYGSSCSGALAGNYMGESPLTAPSEDCLTVNVWTRANSTSEKIPTMIWIYGGGFEFGTSAMATYDGSALAREGVVVVSFNYRLGVLGYLALPELDAEGTMSGNFGLQDQLAAIRWVKKNIAAFGGDPDNITIWGQSAGAHSVGLLMASPLSDGLFQKAIIESGAYWDSEHGSIETFSHARTKGKSFKKKLNVSSIAQLRALPVDTVVNAALWNPSLDPGFTAFAPNTDKFVVPKEPAEIFDLAQTQQIPPLGRFQRTRRSYIRYTSSASQYLRPLYPGDTEPQATNSAYTLTGDLVISEQTFEALDRQARSSSQDVYAYYYNYTSPYSPVAIHTAEINFVFGNLVPSFSSSESPTASDEAFSEKMRKYWTNFAKTGNPNGDGLPKWPEYKGQGEVFLMLGNTIAPIENPGQKRFDFISSLRMNGALPASWWRQNL